MNSIIRSIVRTPGVLFMAIMAVGFLINGGVEYINNTGFEGPNVMAAAALIVAQVMTVIIYQVRRFNERRVNPAIHG